VQPTMEMPVAVRELNAFARGLRERFPDHGVEWEVYVTVPGAEIEAAHPIVRAIERCHEHVFGERPETSTVRWFSDASALTRYGIASVNYGTSSGLPDAKLGENLDIAGLVRMATVYALAAAEICEVDE
jgi:acetylornithine deacetylase/succinyl-diaminopimelate desuccinylase-like protein